MTLSYLLATILSQAVVGSMSYSTETRVITLRLVRPGWSSTVAPNLLCVPAIHVVMSGVFFDLRYNDLSSDRTSTQPLALVQGRCHGVDWGGLPHFFPRLFLGLSRCGAY